MFVEQPLTSPGSGNNPNKQSNKPIKVIIKKNTGQIIGPISMNTEKKLHFKVYIYILNSAGQNGHKVRQRNMKLCLLLKT